MKEGYGFRSLHPAVLLVYYAGGTTFGMLLFHPVVLFCGFLGLVVVNVSLDGAREWRRWSLPMLLGTMLVVLVNPLLSHRGRTVLVYLGDVPITLESVVYGVTLGAALLNVMTLFVSYRLVITEQKFLYLFGRLSPKMALVVMMATGLVPRLRRRLAELTLVQRTRGVTLLEGSLSTRARNAARLAGTLLTWTLEDALQTADSMQARGYGTGPRSSYLRFRMRGRDWTAVGCLALAAGAGLALWFNGHGHLNIYPRIETFAWSRGDAWAAVAYAAFLLIPLGLEWRDRRVWRLLNSGM